MVFVDKSYIHTHWKSLKFEVYVNIPKNTDDLIERIRQKIRLISAELIENMQRNFSLKRIGRKNYRT